MDSWFLILCLCYHYLFWCPNCPGFDQWELFQAGFYVFLINLLQFLKISLLPGTKRYSRLLHFPCLSPGISHFPNDLCFLLVETVLKNWDLGARCAHWLIWVLGVLIDWLGVAAPRLSQRTRQSKGICVHTHINIYSVSVYWNWWDHTDTSNSNLISLYSPWLGSDTLWQTIISPIKYTLLTPLEL